MTIAVTVVGGFLGAGKTTLLNHVLVSAEGRRIAVLVNDFGAIDIDSGLISARSGETISLANGCICCSMADGLVVALLRLLERRPAPEHLVIEASGVGDPARIAEIAYADPSFRLDGIIVLADAERIRALAEDRRVGDTVRRQLAGADLVVLNKADLVAPEDLAGTRAWLHAEVPGARVVEAVQARVPLAVLLGEHSDRPREAVVHHHAHELGFTSWSFTTERAFDRARLAAALDALPETVLRAKGLVALADAPLHRTVLQMVGRRHELVLGEPWGAELPSGRLVAIGLAGGIDAAALDALFADALVR